MTADRLAILALVLAGVGAPAHGQQAQWAAADSETAKLIVDAERRWAEAACTYDRVTQSILAEDFQGTSPDGKRYTKSDEAASAAASSTVARDCRLLDASVRLFGDDLAMVYGRERSVRRASDGSERARCLIWTDTWLKRSGKWQIIAAQDTQLGCDVIGSTASTSPRAAPQPRSSERSGLTPVPLWAFPVEGELTPAIDLQTQQRLPESRRTFTLAQLADNTAAADWFPHEHPSMPTVVRGGGGRAPACGYCHLPGGVGRPENAILAGMPSSYISRQVSDMRSGARRVVDAHFVPGGHMLEVARVTSATDVEAAARYFSGLRYTKRVKVTETDRIPRAIPHDYVYYFDKGGVTVPIGERIVEGPDDPERFKLRDPRTTYTAYVPVGSIARGAALARGDGSTRPPCAVCHGPALRGTSVGPPIAGHFATFIFRQLYAFKSGTRNGSYATLMKPIVADLSRRDMIDLAAYISSLTP